MQVHPLVKTSGEVGSGAMRVARLRYFAAVPASLLQALVGRSRGRVVKVDGLPTYDLHICSAPSAY